MVVAGQMSGHNERLPAWRRPEAKFAKGTEIDMQSYADLHALIKKQVREGRVLGDWKSATHSDEINEWIQVSRKCLILMENLIPTLLREFEGLHFHFRVPEEAMFSEVLEEGGGIEDGGEGAEEGGGGGGRPVEPELVLRRRRAPVGLRV